MLCFYSDENVPEIVEDLFKRANDWLTNRGIVLGEGETIVSELPERFIGSPYHRRYSFMITGPRLDGPYPLVDHIKD